MDLREALRRRRMRRSFDGRAVDLAELVHDCTEALRAPTAGNSAGVYFRVVPPTMLASFFAAATDTEWRARAPRAAGLQRAGAAVIVTCRPDQYAERYAESDKASSGLSDPGAWPLPYWHADAAMATMALLLLAEDRGWAVTLWGAFRRQGEILEFSRADPAEELFGTVLVGWDDGRDRPSASVRRDGPKRAERVLVLGAD